jgi:hypothetical protein
METRQNCKLAIEKLTHKLEVAEAIREKRFTQIVRFFRRNQKKPASCTADQIRHDIRFCELLTEYGKESEIVGMTDFVRELKIRAQSPMKRKAVFSSAVNSPR